MTNGVAREELQQFIERIERLDEERKAIVTDIKDVYNEAGSRGFDKKILRMVIKIRAQDKDERAEQEALLEMYLNAIQPSLFDDEAA